MLQHSVIDDRQGLAIVQTKNQDKAKKFSRPLAIILMRPCVPFPFWERRDVRLDPLSKNAPAFACPFHTAPLKVSIGHMARSPDVDPWPAGSVVLVEFLETFFQSLHTGLHRQKLGDIIVVYVQHRTI